MRPNKVYWGLSHSLPLLTLSGIGLIRASPRLLRMLPQLHCYPHPRGLLQSLFERRPLRGLKTTLVCPAGSPRLPADCPAGSPVVHDVPDVLPFDVVPILEEEGGVDGATLVLAVV
jgi:hypothetical protein